MPRGICPLNPEFFSLVQNDRAGPVNYYRALTNDELWERWDAMSPLERQLKSMSSSDKKAMERLSKK